MDNDLDARRADYCDLNTRLAQMDNRRLLALLEGNETRRGWGRNHVVRLGRRKIFVKRIAVTDLEHQNPYSTKNLFRLPTYYNIGVGSAGMGVNREILSHIKATNWVLEGACPHFPLLYHHRILPFSGEHPGFLADQRARYIKYWNSNKNIDRFVQARATAGHEVVLFLEYVPHMLRTWLVRNIGQIDSVINQMRTAINFLRGKGVIHFDANAWNIVTDGRRMYLADFGLVLDRSFDLSKRELDFFKGHTYYDGGQFLGCLELHLRRRYDLLGKRARAGFDARYGIEEGIDYNAHDRILLSNVEDAAEALKLDAHYVDLIVKHRDTMLLMNDFFYAMSESNRKNARLDHPRLRRLLKASGFAS